MPVWQSRIRQGYMTDKVSYQRWWQVCSNEDETTASGRLFQTWAAAAGKARLLAVSACGGLWLLTDPVQHVRHAARYDILRVKSQTTAVCGSWRLQRRLVMISWHASRICLGVALYGNVSAAFTPRVGRLLQTRSRVRFVVVVFCSVTSQLANSHLSPPPISTFCISVCIFVKVVVSRKRGTIEMMLQEVIRGPAHSSNCMMKLLIVAARQLC